MIKQRVIALSGATLLALTSAVSAGPMPIARGDLIAPGQSQVETIAYRRRVHHYAYHRGYGISPIGAIAGTALGLGLGAATLGCGFAGCGYGPYYGYGGPYYGGGYYGGGVRTGRSVGFGGGFHGGGVHGGGAHGGGHR